MAFTTINRRLRRQTRAGCWLVCLAASFIPAVLVASQALTAQLLWLVLPLAVGIGGHRWMKHEGGVAVLVYHSVSGERNWLPWAYGTSVEPKTFERQLRALRDLGCNVISTAELVEARRAKKPLPAKPVVIHLDDGYLDNWVAAFPLLKRHGLKATLFVSLDFIEDGAELRPGIEDPKVTGDGASDLEWSGYLNWAELKAMDSSGFVDVQSHGIEHGRVVTGPRVVDKITPENWRRNAWVQWAGMNGDKSSWFRHKDPPLVPCGSPVFESRPALASRARRDGLTESEEEHEARVRDVLQRSRETLGQVLEKEIRFFCWPYNTATATGRRLAEEVGFWASTAGMGENRPEEDPRVISRTTVLDHVLAWRWPWLDKLAFRGWVRLCHGNYYWYPLLLSISVLSRVTRLFENSRRSAGR